MQMLKLAPLYTTVIAVYELLLPDFTSDTLSILPHDHVMFMTVIILALPFLYMKAFNFRWFTMLASA